MEMYKNYKDALVALDAMKKQNPEKPVIIITHIKFKKDGTDELIFSYSIKEQSIETCLYAVIINPNELQNVVEEFQTLEMCLKAVKEDGHYIEFVKNQTPEICLEAVKQNGWALQYVKELTLEICLEALKEDINCLALLYAQKNFKLCKELKELGHWIEYIDLEEYWYEDFDPVKWYNKEEKRLKVLESL